MTSQSQPEYLKRPDGEKVAFRRNRAARAHDASGRVGLLWCGGFKSDMLGTKAEALNDWASATGRNFVRFDYFGHGESSGVFTEGTIGQWRDDTLAVLDQVCDGPQIIIGSSMGGWMALMAALARRQRVKGLVLIAPAPDMTEDLMWETFSPEIRATLERDGVYREPSEYDDEPYEITLKLIDEGRQHLILRGTIELDCPVRILHGMEDPDVPWQHSLKIIDRLKADDVRLTLVKHGDHRLSTPADLKLLEDTLEALCAQCEG